MPQVSLYMNDEIFAKVRNAAERDKESVSKWISRALEKTLAQEWPKGFENLFGSIVDEAFSIPTRDTPGQDVPREPL